MQKAACGSPAFSPRLSSVACLWRRSRSRAARSAMSTNLADRPRRDVVEALQRLGDFVEPCQQHAKIEIGLVQRASAHGWTRIGRGAGRGACSWYGSERGSRSYKHESPAQGGHSRGHAHGHDRRACGSRTRFHGSGANGTSGLNLFTGFSGLAALSRLTGLNGLSGWNWLIGLAGLFGSNLLIGLMRCGSRFPSHLAESSDVDSVAHPRYLCQTL